MPMDYEDRSEEPEVVELEKKIEAHRAAFEKEGLEHDPDCIAVKTDRAGATVGWSKKYADNWDATFGTKN